MRGLAESRTMYCRFKQTVWFMEGDDAGAELNQPQFVIEEPGGETSLAQDSLADSLAHSLADSLGDGG